jgi:DNA-binding MarR family transcriptional regulator
VTDKTGAVSAWEALFRAQVSVTRHLNAEFPTEVLSLNEYDVLFNLSRQPKMRLRIRDLNQHVLLTQPSVSRLVDRLAVRGLVAKTPDPDDARGIIVTLTDDGFQLFRLAAVSHVDSISERVGTALSTEELQRLTELCDKLRLAGPNEH